MKTVILGFEIGLTRQFGFHYHDWHLASTTKFMNADCCKFICVGFIWIKIWGYNGWLEELGIK